MFCHRSGRPDQVRSMSIDRLLKRALPLRVGLTSLALLALGSVLLGGCADHSLNLDRVNTAFLSMAATFPELANEQLGQVDAWRVRVLRPGEGVIAEDAGSVSPEQQTVTVEISVELQAPCEVLTIVIELSSTGEVWFRSERPTEVCAGGQNAIQAQELQWVGPVIGLSPTALPFTLEEGGSPRTQTLTVSNQGGGTLRWSASEDRWWLEISPASGSLGPGQSAAVSVTVSDLDLTGGEYQGLITVTDPNAINSPQTASVTLTYIQKPRIGLSTTSLFFETQEGVNPGAKSFTVTNTGGGTLGWSATDGAEWLSLSPISGSLGAGQSQVVQVLVSPGALPGGTYGTTITVGAPGAADTPRTVAVDLTVIPKPRIGLNPTDLSFTTARGENPAAKVLTIRNDGGQTLNWTGGVNGGSWLGLSPAAGSVASGQSQNVTVSVSAINLNSGSYTASITLTAPGAQNSPQTVPVTLTVNPGPLIGLSTTTLNISMTEGVNPSPREVVVSNAGGGVLEWQATDDASWIGLQPTSGTLGTVGGVGLAQTLTVLIDAATRGPGAYRGTVTVFDPGAENSPQTIAVNLYVRARTAPVIADLTANLIQLEHPSCPVQEVNGSLYEGVFTYSDLNGDLPISGGFFIGTPVEVRWANQYTEGYVTVNTTAAVSGDGFGGQASFEICLGDQYNNDIYFAVTLEDAWGLISDRLEINIPVDLGPFSPGPDPASRTPEPREAPGVR